MQRCLIELTRDGWRPISHEDDASPPSVILARVPYAAGAKLPTHGALRYADADTVVLSVSGAIMRRWTREQSNDDVFERAIAELSRAGWRVARRHSVGATLVRG